MAGILIAFCRRGLRVGSEGSGDGIDGISHPVLTCNPKSRECSLLLRLAVRGLYVRGHMNIKGGRRVVAGAVSKVWFEVLEGRVLLSVATGPVVTVDPPVPSTITVTLSDPSLGVMLQFVQQPVFDAATGTVSYTLQLVDAHGNPITVDAGVSVITDLETVDASGNPVASDNYGNGFVAVHDGPVAWLPMSNSGPVSNASLLVSQGIGRTTDSNGLVTVTGQAVDRIAQDQSTYLVGNELTVNIDTGQVSDETSEPLNQGHFTYEVRASAAFNGVRLSATSDTFDVEPIIAAGSAASAQVGVTATSRHGKISVIAPLPSGNGESENLLKISPSIVNQLLNAGGTAGGVLSISNSPFSGANGNPLLA
jgi:hypothetical protein